MNTKSRLKSVTNRIKQAEEKYGRSPDSVQLLAVSKVHPAEKIREAHAAGQTWFGENYLQEALDKMEQLSDLDLDWHFIGAIQSNKTRQIAEHFNWAHGVNSIKVARRLGEQRPDSLDPINICLQVNISGEESKSGISPDTVITIARDVMQIPGIKLRGLMAIPEYSADFEQQRKPFRKLRELLEQSNQQGMEMDTLSMGMSGDMEAAIAEGATIVRIGTDIFGERPKKQG